MSDPINDDPNNIENWSLLHRRVEAFRQIRELMTGPKTRIPLALVRQTLAEQYGCTPEEVTPKQINFEVSGLLRFYPAIELVASEPAVEEVTPSSSVIGSISEQIKEPQEVPPPPARLHHNLGDSLAIIGLAIAAITWALAPNFFAKSVTVLIGMGLLIYLSYRSHFVRNWPNWGKHIGAIVTSGTVLLAALLQLIPQWRQEHTIQAPSEKLSPLEGPKSPPQPQMGSTPTTPPLGLPHAGLGAAPAYNLENVTEAIWFGFHGSSKSLAEQFRETERGSLELPSDAPSVNSGDRLRPQIYDLAWGGTFGKMLPCDPSGGVMGSGITVAVSRHPTIELLIVNSSNNGSPCRVAAHLVNAIHEGGTFGEAGQQLGYILDLPLKSSGFGPDGFGLRFYMTGEAIKGLTQGDLPQWKSFAIDDPKESIQLEVTRKGGEWRSDPKFEELLPKRLMLTTDLMYGGPKVVREFELVSKIPQEYARGGDGASGTITWAFTWRRVRYGEEKSDISGSN